LVGRGLRATNHVKQIWSLNPTVGAPIKADRLWLFTSWTKKAADNYVANLYQNVNPAAWLYVPDLTRQAVWEKPAWAGNGRITWQASKRNKVNVYAEHEVHCDCTAAYAAFFRAPEALFLARFKNTLAQATWQSPITNRLLLEARSSWYHG